MYRIILIIGLLVILFILLRRAVREFKHRHLDQRGLSVDQDQMVQDPVCRTFVVRKIAFEETIGGQTYCFCSRQCAATFAKQQSG
jgi:YHS domain-containing protein